VTEELKDSDDLRRELAAIVSGNLRLHSRRVGSIAQLCRLADISRTQFNKYLSGESLPSIATLGVIANAIGKSPSELLRDNRGGDTEHDRQATAARIASLIPPQAESSVVESIEGYYFELAYSDVFSETITVSVVRIRKDPLGMHYKRKTPRPIKSSARTKYWNYSGEIFHFDSNICILYINEFVTATLGYYILRPASFVNSDMIGFRSGLTSSIPPKPVTNSVYYKFIGRRLGGKDTLKLCKIYTLDEVPKRLAEHCRHLKSSIPINSAGLVTP